MVAINDGDGVGCAQSFSNTITLQAKFEHEIEIVERAFCQRPPTPCLIVAPAGTEGIAGVLVGDDMPPKPAPSNLLTESNMDLTACNYTIRPWQIAATSCYATHLLYSWFTTVVSSAGTEKAGRKQANSRVRIHCNVPASCAIAGMEAETSPNGPNALRDVESLEFAP